MCSNVAYLMHNSYEHNVCLSARLSQGACGFHHWIAWTLVFSRDVWNRFSYNFGSVSVQFLKKTWIWFGMSFDRFDLKKTQFCLDITVIYYLRNS